MIVFSVFSYVFRIYKKIIHQGLSSFLLICIMDCGCSPSAPVLFSLSPTHDLFYAIFDFYLLIRKADMDLLVGITYAVSRSEVKFLVKNVVLFNIYMHTGNVLKWIMQYTLPYLAKVMRLTICVFPREISQSSVWRFFFIKKIYVISIDVFFPFCHWLMYFFSIATAQYCVRCAISWFLFNFWFMCHLQVTSISKMPKYQSFSVYVVLVYANLGHCDWSKVYAD